MRENSDVATVPQTSSKSLDASSTASKSTTQRKKSSVPVTPFDNSKWKQRKSDAGRSMEDKMNKISKSVVEKKRLSPRKASSISSIPQSGTKSISGDNKTVKNGSLTVSKHSVTQSNSHHSRRSHSETSGDDGKEMTRKKSALNKNSTKMAKKVNKKSADVINVKNKTVKKRRKKGIAQNESDSSDNTSVPKNYSLRRNISSSSMVRSSPKVTQTLRKEHGRFGDQGDVTRRDKTRRTVVSRTNVPKGNIL